VLNILLMSVEYYLLLLYWQVLNKKLCSQWYLHICVCFNQLYVALRIILYILLCNEFCCLADKVCDGRSTLSLSPYAVKVLHDSFCRITNSDVRNPAFDVIPSTFIEFDTYRELLFLYDIAQRATDLKVSSKLL